jgi:hypothetical protein
MMGKRMLPPVIAVMLLTVLLCGCVGDGNGGDGDGVTWEKPTKVRVEGVDAVEPRKAFNITLRLYDGSSRVTEWDVQLRLMAVDSKGLEMLNRTFDVKAKGFTTRTVDRVVDTWYCMTIPFSLFSLSSDKTLGFLEGRQMVFFAWIVYDGMTYKQSPDNILINMAIIPDALLLPNQPPVAAISGPEKAFVDEPMRFSAANSTDDMGLDGLSFEWDWGDGSMTSWLVGKANESHTYDAEGKYTVTITVTDADGVNSTASMEVTIEELIRIGINDKGVISVKGDHYGDWWISFNIVNVGPSPQDLSGFKPVLLNVTDHRVPDNGTNIVLPDEIDVSTTITIVFYFNAPDYYLARFVELYDRLIML